MLQPTVITTDKKHKKTNVFKREQKENKNKRKDELASITRKYQRLQTRQKNLKKKIKKNTTPIRTIVQDQGGIRKVTKSVGNVETSQYEEI